MDVTLIQTYILHQTAYKMVAGEETDRRKATETRIAELNGMIELADYLEPELMPFLEELKTRLQTRLTRI